jgi:hypothetical protein
MSHARQGWGKDSRRRFFSAFPNDMAEEFVIEEFGHKMWHKNRELSVN